MGSGPHQFGGPEWAAQEAGRTSPAMLPENISEIRQWFTDPRHDPKLNPGILQDPFYKTWQGVQLAPEQRGEDPKAPFNPNVGPQMLASNWGEPPSWMNQTALMGWKSAQEEATPSYAQG